MTNSTELIEEARTMTSQEFVLSIYPTAHIEYIISKGFYISIPPRDAIVADPLQRLDSEEEAWDMALDHINKRILEKLES